MILLVASAHLGGVVHQAWGSPSVCGAIFRRLSQLAKASDWEQSLDRHVKTMVDSVQDLHARCGSNRSCLEKGLEGLFSLQHPAQRTFLQKHFHPSCLLSGRGDADLARRAQGHFVQNSLLGLAALNMGYVGRQQTTGEAEYPFGMLVYGQVMNVIYAELACRNRVKPDRAMTRMQRFRQDYNGYAKMALPATVGYVGAIAAEDWVRGEDITDPQKLQAYMAEGVVSLVWDLGFGALNAFRLNQLFVDDLPAMRRMIQDGIDRGLIQAKARWIGDQKTLVFVFRDLPGHGVETGVRWAWSSFRSYLWLLTSDATQDAFSDPASANEPHRDNAQTGN